MRPAQIRASVTGERTGWGRRPNTKGTFKLTGGTGRYKGISGSGTYALSFIAISTRLKNGTCNPSRTAPLAAQQQEIAAVGKVSLR
jgi:hypothetical protein